MGMDHCGEPIRKHRRAFTMQGIFIKARSGNHPDTGGESGQKLSGPFRLLYRGGLTRGVRLARQRKMFRGQCGAAAGVVWEVGLVGWLATLSSGLSYLLNWSPSVLLLAGWLATLSFRAQLPLELEL